MNVIIDKTLWIFDFCISITNYFEKKISHFINVSNIDLSTELLIDNLNHIITNSEEKVIKEKKLIHD